MSRFPRNVVNKLAERYALTKLVAGLDEMCAYLAKHPEATVPAAAVAGTAAPLAAAALPPVLFVTALALFLGSTWKEAREKTKDKAAQEQARRELTELSERMKRLAALQEESLLASQIEEIIDRQHRPLAEMNDEDRCYAYIKDEVDAISTPGEYTTAQVLEALGIVGDDSNERVRRIEIHLRDERFRDIRKAWNFELRYLRTIPVALQFSTMHGIDRTISEQRIESELRTGLCAEATFIPLNLADDVPGKPATPLPFDSFLDSLTPGRGGRLLIRGHAGMGKSSLLDWIARHAADGCLTARTSPERAVALRRAPAESMDEHDLRPGLWRSCVPFRIRMRDCPDWTLPSDVGEFTSVSLPGGTKADSEWVQNILNQGRALLLIDGLDEIPTVRRDHSLAALRTVVELEGRVKWGADGEPARGNLFVVTSRRLHEEPPLFRALGFRETLISPLSRTDRDLLMRRWYDAAAEAVPKMAAAHQAKRIRIVEELDANPDVAELCESPLVCAMICALCPTPDEPLPEEPRQVLLSFCRVLAHKRDAAYFDSDRGASWSAELRALNADARCDIASMFALQMLEDDVVWLPEAKALEILRGELPRRQLDAQQAEPLLKELAERVGLLRWVHRDLKHGVEFCHNVLKEFLAASRVVAGGVARCDWLLARLQREDCRNALAHAIAIPEGGLADHLVRGLLYRAERESGPGGTLRLLAVRSVTPAISVDVALVERVRRLVDDLVPPRTPDAADALGKVGHRLRGDVIAKLKFDPALAVEHQVLCARALARMRGVAARELLKEYFERADGWSIALELANAVPLLSIPWALARFLAGDIPEDIRRGVADRDLPALLDARDLRALDFSYSRVTDAGLKELARAVSGLKAVTKLDLAATWVTDAGFKELARHDTGVKALTTLNLGSTGLTDAGLKELSRADSGLKSLTTLILSYTQVTDEGLQGLSSADTGLKALTTLTLTRVRVTDAGLKELSRADTGLKGLTALDLSGTQVTDAGLKDLARADTGLKALTTLYLGRTQVTDAGLKDLARADAGLKALTTLILSYTRVTDTGLKELSRADTGLPALSSLDLESTKVTDAAFKELASVGTGLKALTTLILDDTQVTDAGLKELARADTGLKALAALELRRTEVSDAGLKELARADTGLKALTTLYLSGTQVTDAGLKDLARADTGLKALTTLYLGRTRVTDAGLKDLARADAGLKALTTLYLGGTRVTDAGLAAVKERFPNIKILR